MCKLSNLYVLDLFDNNDGNIVFNVANSVPKLMNKPCKIKVKQIQTELKDNAVDPTADIGSVIYLRVIHNINIQSGTNKNGFSNSNTLAFIDNFQVRTIDTNHMVGFTSTECTLYAPNGLPAILKLNRMGTDIVDNPLLAWSVRLEITINPDEE